MHILVVNDDGPPSNRSSPFVHSLIYRLQLAGHLVSVILPHQQRSWIGKAHLVGEITKPTYFHPGTLHQDDGTTHPFPSDGDEQEEWVLVDGTPATCVQLGLHHFFQDRPAIDLVVSGPNYGRNSTSVFSLSSGTIGGAMEAAVCQKHAIALSFAFVTRDHSPESIADACQHSVKLIEHFAQDWHEDVDLYSINVPLKTAVEERKIYVTNCLQSYWTSGSSFDEVDPDGIDGQIGKNSQNHEKQIRAAEEPASSEVATKDLTTKFSGHKHRHFKWAPKFSDIHKSVEESTPGNDGWAIRQGYTSVTPLKANFMHASSIPLGELKLSCSTGSKPSKKSIFVVLSTDAYNRPLISRSLRRYFQACNQAPSFLSSIASLPESSSPVLEIAPYETLSFEHHLSHASSSLVNAYIIRKALIRKHHLHETVMHWLVKHPDDPIIDMRDHIPLTVSFELDYAEFLDEALCECFELHNSFAHNDAVRNAGEDRDLEWWILKPSLSDQGHGIRLFCSYEDLEAIFQEYETAEDEDSSTSSNSLPKELVEDVGEEERNGIMISQLRHFVAQRYVHAPLLPVATSAAHTWPLGHKFHIRTYVLAVGALKVFVWNEMLALFARSPYTEPSASRAKSNVTAITIDELTRGGHLTNTCLQCDSTAGDWTEDTAERYIHALLDLPLHHQTIYTQIYKITATVFLSAAITQSTHFQTLPNAFEIFGLDFIVNERDRVSLLEINAFPDFKQTGGRLKERVIGGLWEAAIQIVLDDFVNIGSTKEAREHNRTAWRWGEEGAEKERGEIGEEGKMVKVLDIDLGRSHW